MYSFLFVFIIKRRGVSVYVCEFVCVLLLFLWLVRRFRC